MFTLGRATRRARGDEVNDVAGAFSGIAMGLNGAVTSLLVLGWLIVFGRP